MGRLEGYVLRGRTLLGDRADYRLTAGGPSACSNTNLLYPTVDEVGLWIMMLFYIRLKSLKRDLKINFAVASVLYLLQELPSKMHPHKITNAIK